jgi:hypothetical protein
MACGIDAPDACVAQVIAQCREHRGPDALSLPPRIDRYVVEFRDEAPARRRHRIADDARADGSIGAAGKPHEPEFRPREEQVEGTLERLRAGIAVVPGLCEVMRFVG